MNKSTLLRAALAYGLTAAVSLTAQMAPVPAPPSSTEVAVDPNSPPLSTFDGLGAEMDPYDSPPTPERWQTIKKRLEFARFGFIRVMVNSSDYCTGLDAKGNPEYAWDQSDRRKGKGFARLTAVLDFAQSQGVSVYLGEWAQPGKLGFTNPADPRWARIIGGFVEYLIKRKHYTVINHFIEYNEPNGKWMWKDETPNFGQWGTGIQNLRQELDARGLQSVTLAGPDNSGDEDWFSDSVHKMPSLFGAWECHIYIKDPFILDGSVEKQLSQSRLTILKFDPNGAAKPRILGEVGLSTGKNSAAHLQARIATFPYGVEMGDLVAQIADAGWTGASAWMLDDELHVDKLGHAHGWGFWDSGPSSDMTPRPWFYVWSIASRYFPKGSSILKVRCSGDTSEFRAVAAQWSSPSGNQGTVMLINEEDVPRKVTLHASLLQGKKISAYHYFDGERPVNEDSLPVPAKIAMPAGNEKGSVSIIMPARGVILLTTDE